MATALKVSPKYYLEKEEIKIYRSLRHSSNLKKVVSEYKDSESLDLSERESKNERINSLKVKLFEDKLSLVNRGTEALAVFSFQEAQRLIFSSILKKGDNIIYFDSANEIALLQD